MNVPFVRFKNIITALSHLLAPQGRISVCITKADVNYAEVHFPTGEVVVLSCDSVDADGSITEGTSLDVSGSCGKDIVDGVFSRDFFDSSFEIIIKDDATEWNVIERIVAFAESIRVPSASAHDHAPFPDFQGLAHLVNAAHHAHRHAKYANDSYGLTVECACGTNLTHLPLSVHVGQVVAGIVYPPSSSSQEQSLGFLTSDREKPFGEQIEELAFAMWSSTREENSHGRSAEQAWLLDSNEEDREVFHAYAQIALRKIFGVPAKS